MVIMNEVRYSGIWYDLEVGYYSFWDSKYCFDGFFAMPDFKISWDKDQEFCVLFPGFPDRYGKVFSQGDLK